MRSPTFAGGEWSMTQVIYSKVIHIYSLQLQEMKKDIAQVTIYLESKQQINGKEVLKSEEKNITKDESRKINVSNLANGVYYIKLDQYKYAIPFCAMSLGVYFASLYLSATVHAVIFIVGWVFQAIGHYKYEKKSPAFLTNFYHLLIGPYWIYRELFK